VGIDGEGPDVDALRAALDIYVDVYGDLSSLGWILVERDDYGATFIADRSGELLEAPVFASNDGWEPGTIDYCDARPLTVPGGDSIYLDPAFPTPGQDATEIHVLVEEMNCSGASSPEGRLLPPVVTYTANRLTVAVTVRPVGGPATCPGNPRLPVTVVLPEPIGDRTLDIPKLPRF
jgi:hypothetical protein